jgi:hypothetical protein
MKTVEQYLNGQALVAELIAQTSPEPEVVKAFASIAELLRQQERWIVRQLLSVLRLVQKLICLDLRRVSSPF